MNSLSMGMMMKSLFISPVLFAVTLPPYQVFFIPIGIAPHVFILFCDRENYRR
jgi:hypothetical protein